MTSYKITLDGDKAVEVPVEEYGSGQPFLLLHGGAGPLSVAGFGQKFAASDHAHVYVPTHPGFGGTTRPDWLNSIGGLAELYVALVEQLDLTDVTVVGSSIGGWIAAEMALRHSPRISRFVLIDSTGISVEGHPVADIFPLSMDELAKLSYHNPAAFRIDLSRMSDVQKQVMAGNRQALAVYAGQNSTTESALLERLSTVTTPTLVLWGDSDGIVSPEYGRAYATAIPNARFELLPKAGHLPQIETPDATAAAIRDFVAVKSEG